MTDNSSSNNKKEIIETSTTTLLTNRVGLGFELHITNTTTIDIELVTAKGKTIGVAPKVQVTKDIKPKSSFETYVFSPQRQNIVYLQFRSIEKSHKQVVTECYDPVSTTTYTLTISDLQIPFYIEELDLYLVTKSTKCMLLSEDDNLALWQNIQNGVYSTLPYMVEVSYSDKTKKYDGNVWYILENGKNLYKVPVIYRYDNVLPPDTFRIRYNQTFVDNVETNSHDEFVYKPVYYTPNFKFTDDDSTINYYPINNAHNIIISDSKDSILRAVNDFKATYINNPAFSEEIREIVNHHIDELESIVKKKDVIISNKDNIIKDLKKDIEYLKAKVDYSSPERQEYELFKEREENLRRKEEKCRLDEDRNNEKLWYEKEKLRLEKEKLRRDHVNTWKDVFKSLPEIAAVVGIAVVVIKKILDAMKQL